MISVTFFSRLSLTAPLKFLRSTLSCCPLLARYLYVTYPLLVRLFSGQITATSRTNTAQISNKNRDCSLALSAQLLDYTLPSMKSIGLFSLNLFAKIVIFAELSLYLQQKNCNQTKNKLITSERHPVHSVFRCLCQERCKLDVYYPTDIQDAPVVVWFHDKIFANMQRKSPISFDIPKIFSEKLVC